MQGSVGAVRRPTLNAKLFATQLSMVLSRTSTSLPRYNYKVVAIRPQTNRESAYPILNCSANIRVIFEICKFFALNNAKNPLRSLYIGGSIRLKYHPPHRKKHPSDEEISFSTWEIENLHVDIFDFPVSYLKIPT